ncbi:DNA ligase D [Sphingobacterium sp. HJSM2_6]|uniref:DNA ligase D n=1 Tax=Sphingobacterium sp. HJSM2_6 TaxID=3366264 RepID=UPI003BDA00A2
MANLDSYHQKRDFKKTKEPKGISRARTGKVLKFVVQRHHASRLHYDFRLELNGVLKSWAVPKGPSLNPNDKRLAVRVEDHPIEYAQFEGVIPKGNYGAGIVQIFDTGHYDFVENKNEKDFLDHLEKGSIKFRLHGQQLKGEFVLVCMNSSESKNWLLIKHQDQYATDEPYELEKLNGENLAPQAKQFKVYDHNSKLALGWKSDTTWRVLDQAIRPMLATLVAKLPDTDDWIYEKKYDGFRAFAVCKSGRTNLFSRNANLLNKKFPTLIRELNKLLRNCILDGEIVLEDSNGKAYFQGLQKGEPIAKAFSLRYYIFDILEIDDINLRSYPLKERKEVLQLLMKKTKLKHLSFVEALDPKSTVILATAEANQWEGIVAKRNNSNYVDGQRSNSWLKYKIRNSQPAVICGFTQGKGLRSGFGALILGAYEQGKLSYIGNCGSGFTEIELKELQQLLLLHQIESKPFDRRVKVSNESQATWVKPILVCEIYYSEWTNNRQLRHPVYKGLRRDKLSKESTTEFISPKLLEKERIVSIGRKKVTITNQNKIYWPKEGICKGEMLAYYEHMGKYLLPYIKNKPVSLHRYPNGIKGSSFFQKNVELQQLPSWIKTVPIISKISKESVNYLLCNDLATLLYIANLGSIEINTWLSSYKSPEKPKFGVLDLDPNGMDFDELKAVAKTCKIVLDKANVPAFIKTSGSTGFHIFMHVNEQYDYNVVRDFIQFIAQLVHDQHPDTTSLFRGVKQRQGLIYLDYLQNRQGQTIVAPYSVRPKPKASVSTPIFWEELNEDIHIADYNINSLPDRIRTLPDPWMDIFKLKVDIKFALTKF